MAKISEGYEVISRPQVGGEERKYRSLGILYYSGVRHIESSDDYAGVAVQQGRHNWRASDVQRIVLKMAEKKIIFLEAPPQSGKGAIVHGLHYSLKEAGIAVVSFDAHYVKTPVSILEEFLGESTARGGAVLIDSADYFWANRRRTRLNRKIREQRLRSLLSLIARYTGEGVRFLMTLHSPEYWGDYLDPDLFKIVRRGLANDNLAYYTLDPRLDIHDREGFIFSYAPSPLRREEFGFIPQIVLPSSLFWDFAVLVRLTVPHENFIEDRKIITSLLFRLRDNELSFREFESSLYKMLRLWRSRDSKKVDSRRRMFLSSLYLITEQENQTPLDMNSQPWAIP